MNQGKTAMQVTTLANGMKLLLAPRPGTESVTILAMVGVGGRFESKDKLGISHFLEHLPFKGTEHYPNSLAVAQAIDGVGGKHNAFTSMDYTGYWVKIDSRHTKLALDVVSDLLLTPQLRDADIAKEKGVIIEEINMYEDDPQLKVPMLFDELVFSGSSLAQHPLGKKDTVSKLTRSDFLTHYNRWYDPKNVVVGLVGKLQAKGDKLQAEVEEYFRKGKQRTGGGKKTYGVVEQVKPRMIVFYKQTEQAHFYLGYPGISWQDDDRYPLLVMTTLLGGNSSSRLFNEIREKRGLAYYAYASSDMYADAGCIYALEGVNVNQIEEAIKVTLSEFAKMREGKGISKEEVVRAQEYVAGKLTLDLEDSANAANLFVRRLLLEGKVIEAEEILAKIRAVTVEQVRAVAKRLFDDTKLNLAVVGPYKNGEKLGKLIGI